MLRSGICLAAALALWLAGCTNDKSTDGMSGTQGPAPHPSLTAGDLELDIAVEPAKPTADIDAALTGKLRLTLLRHTDVPLRGTITIHPARELEQPGTAQVLHFDLHDKQRITLPATVEVPAGLGVVDLTYPVEIDVNGHRYMTMDLMIAKGRAWRVIGPFAGGPAEDHETVHPPEREIDYAGQYTGKDGRTLRWRPFRAGDIHQDGFYDLNAACADQDLATAYTTLTVDADEATPARVLLGADDSVKVWLNGELIHDHMEIVHPAAPGQDQIDVTLQPGENTFLLKICDNYGGWGYYFDLVGRDGGPLPVMQDRVSLMRVYPTDAHFRIEDVTRTSAVVSWHSDAPKPGRVVVRKALQGRAIPYAGPMPRADMVKADPEAEPIVVKTEALTMQHQAQVTGLEPGTRYLVQIEGALGDSATEPLTFYTAPPAGEQQVLKLKVACVIFTNAALRPDAQREGAQEPVTGEPIDFFKWQIDQTTRFYFVNTGMRLFTDVEYFIDDRFYPMGDEIYGVGSSAHNDGQELFFDVLRRNGRSFKEFDGVVLVSYVKRWDEQRNGGEWVFPHGGGGTLGVMPEMGLGRCAWRTGMNSNDAWLMCHEFHHQIDALYHSSGQPDLLFCHFQPWDDTAHQHGEHWDGIAWTFREWAGYVSRQQQRWPLLDGSKGFRYFTNRWGTVMTVADRDNDGIPDNAPELPFDEQRFGSDPGKADTDGDGLSDLHEALACQWVEYGLGYHWAGPTEAHRCDPRNPDTDGDGLTDGEDPYPLYAATPQVRRAPNAHGPIAFDDLVPLIEMEDPEFTANFLVGWNEDYLSLAMRSKEAPWRARWCLDADNDGWFVGRDNYDMEIFPTENARSWGAWHATENKVLGYAFHNCGVPGKWPFYDPNGLTHDEFLAAHQKGDDGYWVQIHVPRNEETGLSLTPGEEVGVMLTVDLGRQLQRPGTMRTLSVFEPHTFFTLELVPADGKQVTRGRRQ